MSANNPITVSDMRELGAARQAATPAIATSAKMMVQTMGNTARGGFQSGLFNASYHGPRSVIVPPSKATPSAASEAIPTGKIQLRFIG